MKQKNNTGKIIAITAGVAALAAAGYFLFGPEGKKNRHKLKGWMVKMKGEIIEKMEMVKHVTEPIYNDIVDTVAVGYANSGKASKAEVSKLAKELKTHWKSISKVAVPKAKNAAKAGVKKLVKRSVKRIKNASAKK